MYNFFIKADPNYKGIDSLSSEEIQRHIEKITREIYLAVKEQNISKMLKIGQSFPNNAEWWDLDEVYIEGIQQMEGYPFKEIFEDRSDNLLFKILRENCYDYGWFSPSELTPVLNQSFSEIYSRRDIITLYLKDQQQELQNNSRELRGKFPNYKKIALIYEKITFDAFEKRHQSPFYPDNMDIISLEKAQQLNNIEARILLEIIGDRIYVTSFALLTTIFTQITK